MSLTDLAANHPVTVRSHPKYLLVAETTDKGKLAMKALGLDPKEWIVRSPGTALAGMRFEKIVVMPLDYHYEALGPRGRDAFEDWMSLLYLRMHPNHPNNIILL